jgi:hypothetical protein
MKWRAPPGGSVIIVGSDSSELRNAPLRARATRSRNWTITSSSDSLLRRESYDVELYLPQLLSISGYGSGVVSEFAVGILPAYTRSANTER